MSMACEVMTQAEEYCDQLEQQTCDLESSIERLRDRLARMKQQQGNKP